MRSRGRGVWQRGNGWEHGNSDGGICEYANDVKLVYTWFGNRRSEGEAGQKCSKSEIFVVARTKGVPGIKGSSCLFYNNKLPRHQEKG